MKRLIRYIQTKSHPQSSPEIQFRNLLDQLYDEISSGTSSFSNEHMYKQRLWNLYTILPSTENVTQKDYLMLLRFTSRIKTSSDDLISRVSRLLDDMRAKGMNPGEKGLFALLSACKEHPQAASKINQVLESWADCSIASKSVYEFLLQLQTRISGVSQAEKWFQSMEGTELYNYDKNSFSLSQAHIGSLVGQYSKEKNTSAMIEKFHEVDPSCASLKRSAFNKILYGYVKNEKYLDGWNWYNQALTYNIKYDLYSFDIILKCLFRLNPIYLPTIDDVHALNMGELDYIQDRIIKTEESGSIEDTKTKSKLKNNEFLLVFKQMIQQDMKPNISTYNVILSAYIQVGKYHEAIEVFKDMKSNLEFYGDSGTFAIVMKALSKLSRHNEAIGLYKELKSNCIEPDMILLSTVIDVFIRANKLDEALQVYDELLKSNLTPSTITLQMIMHIHCLRCDMSSANLVFEEILQKQQVPSVLQLNILIHGYGLVGDLETCVATLNRMIEMGMKPCSDTYNILMSAYIKAGKIEECFDWYKEMQKAGLEPDECTFNTLIVAFGKMNNDSAMLKLYDSIVEHGMSPDHHTLFGLTSTFARNLKLGEIRELHEKFYEKFPHGSRSMAPHELIMRSFQRLSDRKSVIDEFTRATEKYSLEPTARSFEIILECFTADEIVPARQWFNKALDACKNTLTSDLYLILMRLYKERKDWREIQNLYLDMQKKGVVGDTDVYSIVQESIMGLKPAISF